MNHTSYCKNRKRILKLLIGFRSTAVDTRLVRKMQWDLVSIRQKRKSVLRALSY